MGEGVSGRKERGRREERSELGGTRVGMRWGEETPLPDAANVHPPVSLSCGWESRRRRRADRKGRGESVLVPKALTQQTVQRNRPNTTQRATATGLCKAQSASATRQFSRRSEGEQGTRHGELGQARKGKGEGAEGADRVAGKWQAAALGKESIQGLESDQQLARRGKGQFLRGARGGSKGRTLRADTRPRVGNAPLQLCIRV